MVTLPTFIDPRKHRVIVVVCHEGTNTLYSGSVTLGGVTRSSISAVPAALAAKGVTEADLCNLGGAQFGGLGHGTFGVTVGIAPH